MLDLNTTPINTLTVQNSTEKFTDNAIPVKSVETQALSPSAILKIGQTIGSIFTPAFFLNNIGNIGFDYGVKAGNPVGGAIGQSVDSIITQVKSLPNQIASGIQSFSMNIVGVFIIVILAVMIFKKAVK